MLDCSEEEEIPFQKGGLVYGPNIGLPHMGRKMDFQGLDTVELNLGFHLPGVWFSIWKEKGSSSHFPHSCTGLSYDYFL